jgi:hypothetical protein
MNPDYRRELLATLAQIEQLIAEAEGGRLLKGTSRSPRQGRSSAREFRSVTIVVSDLCASSWFRARCGRMGGPLSLVYVRFS